MTDKQEKQKERAVVGLYKDASFLLLSQMHPKDTTLCMRHIMCMFIPNDFYEVPDQEACGHFSMRLPTSP